MIENLTGYDIAAEAEMVRAKFKGTILFLEGHGDMLLFERFVDTNHCYPLIAHGKENAVEATQILEDKGFPGIIAIVDADHWHIVGYVCLTRNVVLTHLHDVELIIIQSNAFIRLIKEYASPPKLAEFLKRDKKSDLRDVLLEKCFPIGIFRLISYEKKLNLKFNELKFKSFVDVATLNIDIRKMVTAVASNTKKTGINPQELISKVQRKMTANTYERYQVCSGHDVT